MRFATGYSLLFMTTCGRWRAPADASGMNEKSDAGVWFSVRELAARFKISQDAVYNLLTDNHDDAGPGGKLLAKRIGGAWRVHAAALAEFEAPAIPRPRRRRETFRTVPDALGRKRHGINPSDPWGVYADP